jgi:3-isopropylmalate dehydrogenase
MVKKYRVVALPGEGIGIEVVGAALSILKCLAQQENFVIHVDEGWIGQAAHDQFGQFFPEATAQLCQASDGIIFGAVAQGGLLELRQRFDFFVNLRPVRSHPLLLSNSPLKPELLQDVDLLFVRELASGLYFGPAGRAIDASGPYGYHTMQYHDREIQRIARVALQKAQERRQHLTVAHKENALPQIPWCRLVAEVAQDFADVTVEPMLVDNLAMQLIMRPRDFDVILAGNLFGDILSDLGGAIAGSIGLLGSASFSEQGLGLYEPVHGTAPDIAGQGIANPLGMMNSITLMLEHWGEHTAALRLQQVQQGLLEQGYRTADLCLQPANRQVEQRQVGTQELAQLFCDRLTQTTP